MPFRSKAQQRWMFATHPQMAREWAEHTPDFSKLPEKVRKTKKKKPKKPDRVNTKQADGTQTVPDFVRRLAKLAETAKRKQYPALVSCRTVTITMTRTAPAKDSGKSKQKPPELSGEMLDQILPDFLPDGLKAALRRMLSRKS